MYSIVRRVVQVSKPELILKHSPSPKDHRASASSATVVPQQQQQGTSSPTPSLTPKSPRIMLDKWMECLMDAGEAEVTRDVVEGNGARV